MATFNGRVFQLHMRSIVKREIYAVDGLGVGEASEQIVQDALEARAHQRPSGDRERREERDGRPPPREPCGLHEARQLGVSEVAGDLRGGQRRRSCERVALEVVHALEVFSGRQER